MAVEINHMRGYVPGQKRAKEQTRQGVSRESARKLLKTSVAFVTLGVLAGVFALVGKSLTRAPSFDERIGYKSAFEQMVPIEKRDCKPTDPKLEVYVDGKQVGSVTCHIASDTQKIVDQYLDTTNHMPDVQIEKHFPSVGALPSSISYESLTGPDTAIGDGFRSAVRSGLRAIGCRFESNTRG